MEKLNKLVIKWSKKVSDRENFIKDFNCYMNEFWALGDSTTLEQAKKQVELANINLKKHLEK